MATDTKPVPLDQFFFECSHRALANAATDLYEALEGLMPRNLGRLPESAPDSSTLPLDVTFGEMRAAIAALQKARAQ